MLLKKTRSLLFDLSLILTTLVVGLTFLLPSLISDRIALKTAKLWAKTSLMFLKLICNIDYKVIGRENIPKNSSAIIASKHQSAWETLAFLLIFEKPVFIHKKELLKVPVLGSYLKHANMIAIDRNNSKSAINNITSNCKQFKDDKKELIIFPEGTRTKYGEKSRIKPGIFLIAKQTGLPVIPVSLDSGRLWSKELNYKQSGTITVKIGEEIKLSENKSDFLKELENKI